VSQLHELCQGFFSTLLAPIRLTLASRSLPAEFHLAILLGITTFGIHAISPRVNATIYPPRAFLTTRLQWADDKGGLLFQSTIGSSDRRRPTDQNDRMISLPAEVFVQTNCKVWPTLHQLRDAGGR